MLETIRNSVSGIKTYLVAAILVLCVVAEKLLGVDIPGFDAGTNWFETVMAAIGLSALRAGVTKSSP